MKLPAYRPEWLQAIRAQAPYCEALRPYTRKPKATGTISEAAALYLWAVVEAVKPRVCVEVGTFIGTSALVLASSGATVYTCDKDNHAFKGTDTIVAYGKTSSTAMLADLSSKPSCSVDLWFFDGRIQADDLPMIAALSSPTSVYAFDDYEGKSKGVVNVGHLAPQLPAHRVVAPPRAVYGLASQTSIALLVPEARP